MEKLTWQEQQCVNSFLSIIMHLICPDLDLPLVDWQVKVKSSSNLIIRPQPEFKVGSDSLSYLLIYAYICCLKQIVRSYTLVLFILPFFNLVRQLRTNSHF